jgi:hypothetical protein
MRIERAIAGEHLQITGARTLGLLHVSNLPGHFRVPSSHAKTHARQFTVIERSSIPTSLCRLDGLRPFHPQQSAAETR